MYYINHGYVVYSTCIWPSNLDHRKFAVHMPLGEDSYCIIYTLIAKYEDAIFTFMTQWYIFLIHHQQSGVYVCDIYVQPVPAQGNRCHQCIYTEMRWSITVLSLLPCFLLICIKQTFGHVISRLAGKLQFGQSCGLGLCLVLAYHQSIRKCEISGFWSAWTHVVHTCRLEPTCLCCIGFPASYKRTVFTKFCVCLMHVVLRSQCALIGE